MAGYDWNYGMSNNAVAAYRDGLVPFSKLDKKIRILIDMIGDRQDFSTEWHHTSKYFNVTYFYKESLNLIIKKYPKRLELLFKLHDEIMKNAITFYAQQLIKQGLRGEKLSFNLKVWFCGKKYILKNKNVFPCSACNSSKCYKNKEKQYQAWYDPQFKKHFPKEVKLYEKLKEFFEYKLSE